MASSEFEHHTLTIYERGQNGINFVLVYIFQNKSILKRENSSQGKIIQQVVPILRREGRKLREVRKCWKIKNKTRGFWKEGKAREKQKNESKNKRKARNTMFLLFKVLEWVGPEGSLITSLPPAMWLMLRHPEPQLPPQQVYNLSPAMVPPTKGLHRWICWGRPAPILTRLA